MVVEVDGIVPEADVPGKVQDGNGRTVVPNVVEENEVVLEVLERNDYDVSRTFCKEVVNFKKGMIEEEIKIIKILDVEVTVKNKEDLNLEPDI